MFVMRQILRRVLYVKVKFQINQGQVEPTFFLIDPLILRCVLSFKSLAQG